jgi:prepilin signal peptidase PulO-like enzyme (type II secretory pathway)
MNLFIKLIVGVLVSLLLNYMADVLPETRKFSRPVCRRCGHKFSAREYLFSFNCPECQAKPKARYWIVLVLSMILSVLLALFPLEPLTYWESIPLLSFLGLIAIIDIEHRAVLFETDIVGIILGVIYGLLLHKPLLMILGGVGGAVIMIALYYFGKLFNLILGKIRKQEIEEVALGFGDVFVCGYLGLITGWPQVVGMVIIAIFLGGIFALIYLLIKILTKKYSAFSAIPYAPFLILATLIMFYLPAA